MPRLYSHLREYRKILLANYLCIGFVPGGIQCSVGVWKCLRSLPPDPNPRNWIKLLDPWMQDFYPVLGWGFAPVQGEHNSAQHPHWIKINFPWIVVYRSSKWHCRHSKIISGLIMHFIADTDTDEICFGINFHCRCRHSCSL